MDKFARPSRKEYIINIILSLITFFGIVLFIIFVTRSDVIETPAHARGSGSDPYESPPPASPEPTAQPSAKPTAKPTAAPTVAPTAVPVCRLDLSSNSVTVKANDTHPVDAVGFPADGDFNSSMSSTPDGSQGVSVVDYKDGTADIIICAGFKPCNYDVKIIYSTSDCSVSDTINVEVVASTKPTPEPSPRPTPDLNDTDEDGLWNFIEEQIETDIENWDSDYDGWSDGDEHWSNHDPLDPDDYPTEEELTWPECVHCGTHYNPEEGYTKCPNCGISFTSEIEEYECPACGATVTTEDYECPECGKVLKEE